MQEVLRVGIIGLGRRWRKRYKPALRALRAHVQVRVVCDQVHERAALEAKRLACDLATGPAEMLEREDVDAVLLTDAQWFGLWPIEEACRRGKPVFCCCGLETDDGHADALHRQVQESRLPVVMEMAPRFAPVTTRLRELFETDLGAPRLLLCDVVQRRKVPPHLQRAQGREPGPVADLAGDTGLVLLDWCAGLLGSEPRSVTANHSKPIGFSNLFLEFAGGQAVQITRRHAVSGRPAVRLEVVAEHGTARVELPFQISWTTKDGLKAQTLRGQRPLAQLLLEHFREVVREEAVPAATLEDAYRVLRWLRVAARSGEEGRLLALPEVRSP